MTVTAKCLIEAKYASNSDHTEYTVPASTRTIIDKLTVTNTDGSSQTVNINIVPSGGSVSGSNLVTDAAPISTLVCYDASEMKNQILEAGDFISIKASVASKLVIRASGREVT